MLIPQILFFTLIGSINCIIQPQYTENITQFQSKHYNERLELLIGCWLMSEQYIIDHQETLNNSSNTEKIWLVKQCLKVITRKDAVLKVTELIGKNMEDCKKYQEIVQNIPSTIKNFTLNNFDVFLLDLIEKYSKQLSSMSNSKQQLKNKVQQQIKNKGKYYFGFIPANTFTHTIIFLTISLTFVCFCTLCKYYRRQNQKKVNKQSKKTKFSKNK